MKGQLAIDIILMGIVMIGVVISFIYISSVNTSVLTPMIAQNAANNQTNTQANQMLVAQHDNFSSLWDNLGVFLFAGIWLFLLISSYYIQTSPVFFIVMMVVTVIGLLVIMMLANAFSSLTLDTSGFPMLSWLAGHLLEVTIVVVITCGIALYAKKESGGII